MDALRGYEGQGVHLYFQALASLLISPFNKDIRVKKIEFCHNVLAKSFQRLGDLFVSFITGPLACNRIKKRHIRW